jgi:hypothetical protein
MKLIKFVGTWKITLEIQGSIRPAEHVTSEVAGRSAESDYCKNGWKDARQKNEGKRKCCDINHQHTKGGRISTPQGNSSLR